ncbi:hypothetical protein L9F63_003206, partial [Diploptera punctata]
WRKLKWLKVHDNRSNNVPINMGPQTSRLRDNYECMVIISLGHTFFHESLMDG